MLSTLPRRGFLRDYELSYEPSFQALFGRLQKEMTDDNSPLADSVGGTLCVVGALSAMRRRAQVSGLAGAGHDRLLGVAHGEVSTGVGVAGVLGRLVSHG